VEGAYDGKLLIEREAFFVGSMGAGQAKIVIEEAGDHILV